MQRILVVGAAGVVGSHLVERLLTEGHEVIAIDDLSHGAFANLAHLRRSRRFVFQEHDVRQPYRVDGVDAIFHLAVPSTRVACAEPIKALLTCVLGTRHALDVAAASGARIVIGTAMERFGEGVRCAESLGVSYAKAGDAAVRIVRLPSAFGPRMAADGDHLVTSLVMQALRGERLEPRLPLQRRVRLAYVDDAVETLVRTMASEQHTPAVIAPSTEISVLELMNLVADAVGLVGFETDDTADAGPASMPMSARPTIADALPASIALGFTPTVELPEGIARTVAWFETIVTRATGRASGVFERRGAGARQAG